MNTHINCIYNMQIYCILYIYHVPVTSISYTTLPQQLAVTQQFLLVTLCNIEDVETKWASCAHCLPSLVVQLRSDSEPKSRIRCENISASVWEQNSVTELYQGNSYAPFRCIRH